MVADEPHRLFKSLRSGSVTLDKLDDSFPWLNYYADGKKSRVAGRAGFQPQPLQSWVTRHDTVQHGYAMFYRFDNNCSACALELPVEDQFFAITLDVGLHPDYDAVGLAPNTTLRFSLFEDLAADYSDPETIIQLEGNAIAHQVTLSTDEPQKQRYRLSWGFMTEDSGALRAPCIRKPFGGLTLAVQCLAGFAIGPEEVCLAPNLRLGWHIWLELRPKAASNTPFLRVFNSLDSTFDFTHLPNLFCSALWMFVFACSPSVELRFKVLFCAALQCIADVLSPPALNDCHAYCPFELTLRAVPRKLKDADEVRSLIGPGQWQAFELQVCR